LTICFSLRKRVRKLIANSKGFSSVIGTTFMVLVMLFLSTSVFLWTLSQNTMYNEAVRARSQEEADRHDENVVALSGNYSVSEEEVTVKVVLKNAGSVAVQIINLWVLDTYELNRRYTNKSLNNLNLNPGDVLNLVETVTILGANASHNFVSWFVTARGNTIPLEKEQGVIIAQLAQGIGSITMEFKTFRHHIVDKNNNLGPAQYGFTIPGNEYTVFGINLTNLDESKRNINLTGYSCVWLIVPGTSASASWSIVKVVDGRLVDFDFQVLEYGNPTLIFFGKTNPPASLQWKTAAVNLLLYGKIGSDDYGQNIPFISVYVTG